MVAKNVESEAQAVRFKQTAHEVGADESGDALDRVMGKLDLAKKPEADEKAKPPKK